MFYYINYTIHEHVANHQRLLIPLKIIYLLKCLCEFCFQFCYLQNRKREGELEIGIIVSKKENNQRRIMNFGQYINLYVVFELLRLQLYA